MFSKRESKLIKNDRIRRRLSQRFPCELLTLERPFDTGANDVVAERRRLPNKVEATLNRAMSVAPANRHATAIEFADDLRRALNNRRLPRRAVLVLGVLAATGVAGWSLGRIGRTNRSDERRSGTNGEMNGQEQVSSSLHPDDMAVPTIDGASRGRNSFSLWFCDIEGTPVSTVKPDELFYLACSCSLGEYNLFASSMDIHAAPGLDFSMAGRQSASPYKFLRFSHQAGQVEGEGSRTTVCVMSHAFDPTKIQTDKPLWILPCKALRRGTHQLELSANRNFGESVLVFGQNDPIPESELVLGSATLQVE